MERLYLPESFEEALKHLEESEDIIKVKLLEFFHPVTDSESEISEIVKRMGKTGKIVFLYGKPGTGKSIFAESLSWRKHIPIAKPHHINASELDQNKILFDLISKINSLKDKIDFSLPNRQTFIIDYLENLRGQNPDDIWMFFRNINGILRNYPILIIWPVTDITDANILKQYGEEVSGTIFLKKREIIEFTGPDLSLYPSISKNTISVFNKGKTIEEFNITDDILEKLLYDDLFAGKDYKPPIRDYFHLIHQHWIESSKEIAKIKEKIPKPTEVWFVFSFVEAENIINQFVRKTATIESAWTAQHPKLSEYIHGTQRAGDWNPTRLQMALGGTITTRIFYMPTNALMSMIGSYGDQIIESSGIDEKTFPSNWKKKSEALKHLRNTPIYQQLCDIPPKMGKRRSGPAAKAVENANEHFSSLSKWISGLGKGSDKGVNKAIASAFDVLLKESNVEIISDKIHPWIPNIVPDVQFNFPNKNICLEFSYTNKKDSYVVADYILKKLNRYMKQIELYVG